MEHHKTAYPPNYESVQEDVQDGFLRYTTTVSYSVTQKELPINTELQGPVPAPRRESSSDSPEDFHEYNITSEDAGQLKMVEVQDGKRPRTASCAPCGGRRQCVGNVFLLLAQYVCTASVAHGFSYLRRTAIASEFGVPHFGYEVAAPLIVAVALCVVLAHIPHPPIPFGLAVITVAQAALALVDLMEGQWIYYGHLLSLVLLGFGLHATERTLFHLCHQYYRLIVFFLAFAIQPMVSRYLDPEATYSPALLMALIALLATIIHLFLHWKRTYHPSSESSSPQIEMLNKVQQQLHLNNQLDSLNSTIFVYTYRPTTLSRRFMLFSIFYLVWGKLATIPLLTDAIDLEDEYKPLVFLTYGASAFIIAVVGACIAFLLCRISSHTKATTASATAKSSRRKTALISLSVVILCAAFSIACVVAGLVLDSNLVLDEQTLWSLFVAKALLGAGLAAGAGLMFVLEHPLARMADPGTVASTASSSTTVHILNTTTNSTAYTDNARSRSSSAEDATTVTGFTRALVSEKVLGATVWPMIYVGGAFGIAVSCSLAAYHPHWYVNVVDLVVFLVPIALLAIEALWSRWRQRKSGKRMVTVFTQTETSKL